MKGRNGIFVTDKTVDFLSVTTSLSKDIYEVFSEHAEHIGKSKSEIMRSLILQYLKQQKQQNEIGSG